MKRIKVLLWVIILGIGSSLFAQIPTDGLVAYYPFDGNADDESGNGNHGTVHGATLMSDRFGSANSAYFFDGNNDYVDIDDDPTLQIIGDISICAWVYSEESFFESPSQHGSIMVARGSDQACKYDFSIDTTARLEFDRYPPIWGQAKSTGTVEFNSWHFVGVTINDEADQAVFFIDEMADTVSYTEDYTGIDPTLFLIGAHPIYSDIDHYFKGALDDLRLYNRILSETELQILFHEGGWNIEEGVNNITASQRSDGSKLVDINYNLNGSSQYYQITLEASLDGGTNYTTVSNVTGDVSFGVTPGSGKHIEWDVGAEYADQFSTSAQIRINAEANDTPPGALIDIDGNVYQTIQIGGQVWMAENLRVTHYRNGDPISSLWPSTFGSYVIYDNNADTYGALYNWYAVDDSRNIAPAGWHVPTDDEWKELEMHLGLSQSEADDTGRRGTNEGCKLAGNADLWINGVLEITPGFGFSGFNALPAGFSLDSGPNNNIGIDCSFWTAAERYSITAWYRLLNYNHSGIYRSSLHKSYGFSVRCVRD